MLGSTHAHNIKKSSIQLDSGRWPQHDELKVSPHWPYRITLGYPLTGTPTLAYLRSSTSHHNNGADLPHQALR